MVLNESTAQSGGISPESRMLEPKQLRITCGCGARLDSRRTPQLLPGRLELDGGSCGAYGGFPTVPQRSSILL